MINCMKAWNYLSNLPLNIKTIKQTYKIIMDGEKGAVAWEYRKSSVFAGYHTFASACYIERYMKAQFLDFMKLKRMIQLWPLKTRLEGLSI